MRRYARGWQRDQSVAAGSVNVHAYANRIVIRQDGEIVGKHVRRFVDTGTTRIYRLYTRVNAGRGSGGQYPAPIDKQAIQASARHGGGIGRICH